MSHTSSQREANSWGTRVLWLTILLVCLTVLSSFNISPRNGFVSSEVKFTDTSPAGLQIVPASCASSAAYYHGALVRVADGYGWVSVSGQNEFGVSGATGGYLCISNSSGRNFFIPGKSSAEGSAVKALGTSIPGLQVW